MTMHPRHRGYALCFALLAVAFVAAPATAQDASATAAGGAAALPGPLAGFNLGLGVGATAFNDVVTGASGPALVTTTYQKISLSPDLAFGKFGLGLDITLHVNFSGGPTGNKYLRTEDWVPPIFDATLYPSATTGQKVAALAELYFGKFRYVSWGQRGEPLYIKFGMIDDGTLGNGFLMGNYANTLFLPEKRILGLAFGLDGSLFKFPLLGVETFFGNLARFDVLGGRIYVRPLSLTSIPILKMLAVGATVVVDRNPYLYLTQTTTAAAPVLALGVDAQQPILTSPMASLAVMADWGMLTTSSAAGGKAAGVGAQLGVGGKLVGFLTYGAQVRVIGSRFVPVYFGTMYDLVRGERYGLLTAAAADVAPAFGAWQASIGASFLKDAILFRLGAGGPFSPPVQIAGVPDPTNELNWPEVHGLIKVEGDFLKGFSFLASYDKTTIKTFADLISAENALIQARVNYKTGPAVISFVYNLKYLPEPVGNTRWQVSSGLETSVQLF
jgi:hypothetical protein